MRIRTALFLAVLVAVPLAAQPKTILAEPVRAPFTLDHHIPVLDVKINGQGPFRLGLDTGHSGMLTLSREIATQLKLEKVGEVRASDPSGQNAQTRDLVGVASLEIGGARFENVESTVSDGPRPDRTAVGIMGYALFQDLLLTLDYPKNELRLERGALPEADGKQVLTLSKGRGVPAFELMIGGRKVMTDIDAGSPALLTVPLAVAKELPLVGEMEVVGQGRTISGPFEILAAEVKGDVTIGPRTLHDPRIDIVERFPTANIGYRFLRDYAVTFDARNGRVAFR
jgi:predicted aspartyl protease